MPSMMKVGRMMMDKTYIHIPMVHAHVFFVGDVPQSHDVTWLEEGLDQVGAELLVGMT